MEIAGRAIGPGHRPFLIAEVAQAHDGSLGIAHSFIDAAAEAGADAVKFQTHIASAESTLDEPFRVKFSYEDDTRFDYWRRMEFSPEQWAGLAEHCAARGVVFLSSAFSGEAVELLARLDMPAYKLGSGEVHNTPLLEQILAKGKPLLLSSGMSSFAELDVTAALIRERGGEFALFQATTKYPTPLSEVGLNVIGELRGRYGVPVGLSDHSASVWPPILAMARGADVIEVHVTFDRAMFGPDASASLTFAEFGEVVAARGAFETLDASPVDKEKAAQGLAATRDMFRKSLALRTPLARGTTIEAGMLTGKKPGTGIPLHRIDEVVGRNLARDVGTERLLNWSDFAE